MAVTAEQEKVFDERSRYWMERLGLNAKDVKGHNEFPNQSTNCPGDNMNNVRARLNKPFTTSSVEDKARDLIRKAVKGGVFTSPHTDVDKYTTIQLLEYALIYIERTRK